VGERRGAAALLGGLAFFFEFGINYYGFRFFGSLLAVGLDGGQRVTQQRTAS
jgi:hypothetical protein